MFKPECWAAWIPSKKWKHPIRYRSTHGFIFTTKEYSTWMRIRQETRGKINHWWGPSRVIVRKAVLENSDPQLIESYDVFVETIGSPPTQTSVLARRDVFKGYQADNCCWIEAEEFNQLLVNATDFIVIP